MPTFDAVPIKTERLTLRLLTPADTGALFQVHSHPEVMRYWSWSAWTDPAQASQMIASGHEAYQLGIALQLGLERQSDLAMMGVCNLFHFHAASRRAEIGYVLGRPYWGFGYMHEALQALVRYAFLELELHRLEADIDPRNLASAKTLERLRFTKEGYLRERWIVNGEISDTWLYGLLRWEWQEYS